MSLLWPAAAAVAAAAVYAVYSEQVLSAICDAPVERGRGPRLKVVDGPYELGFPEAQLMATVRSPVQNVGVWEVRRRFNANALTPPRLRSAAPTPTHSLHLPPPKHRRARSSGAS